METRNRLLNVLSNGDLDRWAPHLQRVRLPAGSVLYEPEAALEAVFFPESGLVSIISVMLCGSTAEAAIVGREGAVGFIEAAGSGIIFTRAVVQADLQALRVSASHYREVLNASATLRRAVVGHAELNMAETRQTIACIAHHTADQRLAWWLLEYQDRADTGDRLPLTQEFLAAMLGLQRTTVTAVAASLRDRGLIEYRRGLVAIVDRAGLEARSCECYATNRHFRSLIQGANGTESPRADG